MHSEDSGFTDQSHLYAAPCWFPALSKFHRLNNVMRVKKTGQNICNVSPRHLLHMDGDDSDSEWTARFVF